MFTRNYDNIMAFNKLPIFGSGRKTSPSEQFEDGSLALKTTSGSIKTYVYSSSDFHQFHPFSYILNVEVGATASTGYTYLVIGSGDAPESYDDYCLSHPCVKTDILRSALSYTESDITYNAITKKFNRSFTQSFTALNDVTIREYGFINVAQTNTNASTTSYSQLLIFRKVLDTPVVVERGQTVEFTFQISASANDNKPIIELV